LKNHISNSISGVYKPPAGSVHFSGDEMIIAFADVMCLSGLSRTFQIPRHFPKLTGLENVMVGPVFGAKHDSQKASVEKAKDALDFVQFHIDIDTPNDHLNAECSSPT
jgi:ABC-type branched-subunit amino acid transport system ATPase component